ncbi:MAG: hypothetical protein QNJ41_17090 [Xenococcaceae cyanobacterium MO_188.B32]|nr:hypothetical protein [Xenococcaceae cyanobacterium MO_188.B32]
MKLNWSFFIKTVLTITLFTSATLSAQGKEVTNYAPDRISKSYGEVRTSPTDDSEESEQVSESSDQRLNSKHTISRDLALAILIIGVCQLVQSSCQSQSPEQAQPGRPNRPNQRPLVLGLGLGYFYQSIYGNSNQEVKRETRVARRNKQLKAELIRRDLSHKSVK